MPHVSFLSFSGVRVRETELAALGARLPGLAARSAAITELPALGLLTLAGMLPDDWSCSYREVDEPSDSLIDALVREQPTIVAMSALTASVLRAYRVADRLKEQNILSVLGGLHATACTEEASQHFDVICAGEGEFVWLGLLQDVLTGSARPRYHAVRTASRVSWTVPRYALLAGTVAPRWTLQTQRGCPLACEFCAASRTISRFREKPVELIQEELQILARLTPRPIIELADDNTFAGARDPGPLLDSLGAVGARYFTEVDWRVGERPELLSQMAASGCVQVLLGIESLVFRFPGMGAKQAELSRIMRAIDRIQDAGIAVNGCFIVGADGETRESIRRLQSFIRSSPLADVQVTLSTPFPGTPYRARLERQGRLLRDRDWDHYTLFDVTFQPDRMGIAELELAYRGLLESVYDGVEAKRRAAIRRQIWRRNCSLRGME